MFSNTHHVYYVEYCKLITSLYYKLTFNLKLTLPLGRDLFYEPSLRLNEETGLTEDKIKYSS